MDSVPGKYPRVLCPPTWDLYALLAWMRQVRSRDIQTDESVVRWVERSMRRRFRAVTYLALLALLFSLIWVYNYQHRRRGVSHRATGSRKWPLAIVIVRAVACSWRRPAGRKCAFRPHHFGDAHRHRRTIVSGAGILYVVANPYPGSVRCLRGSA